MLGFNEPSFTDFSDLFSTPFSPSAVLPDSDFLNSPMSADFAALFSKISPDNLLDPEASASPFAARLLAALKTPSPLFQEGHYFPPVVSKSDAFSLQLNFDSLKQEEDGESLVHQENVLQENSSNSSHSPSSEDYDEEECDVEIDSADEVPSEVLAAGGADPVLTGAKPIELLLKPARKNSHKYLHFFPSKLYCAPYKYDLLVRIKSEEFNGKTLDISLHSAETRSKLKCKSDDQEAIVVEKTKATKAPNGLTEIMCRLRFNVCSFHYGKKPFLLCLTFSSEGASKSHYSEPFSTYARKNDKDDIWDKEGSCPMYSVVAAKSMRSRSRNSRMAGSKRKSSFDDVSPKKKRRTSLD